MTSSLHRYRFRAGGKTHEIKTVVGEAQFRRLAGRTWLGLPLPGRVHLVIHPPGWYLPDGTWLDFYAARREAYPLALAHVGHTMFETDAISAEWVASCNDMDEVWVPTEFNRETFARSGVDRDRLHVIPYGLDAERYQPGAARPIELPERAGFNFLSVFEWNRRKGYDVLFRAYAEAFTCDDDVALVVRTYRYLGREDPGSLDLHAYLRQFCPNPARAPRLVVLPERIPDHAMPGLYAACDAFVLPSRGEGWGIPYMEAMATGLPTIGTRWSGNLMFMTDENSYLVDIDGLIEIEPGDREYPREYWGHRMAAPSLEQLKRIMRQVFEERDEGRRRGEIARREVASRWTQRNTTDCVLQRLASIGRARRARSSSASVAPILWSAPLLDPSGYADEARSFLLGLDRLGARVRANPVLWSQRLAELSPQDAEALARLRQTPLGASYVHVQQNFAPAFRADPSAVASVGRTMFETDRLPADWVAKCNEMDEVWVPSDFNLATFTRSGVDARKLRKVPGAIDASRFRAELRPLPLEGRRGFAFLAVFDWSLRKGWDILVRAFVEEFAPHEDVCLYLKVHSSYGLSEQQLLVHLQTYVRERLGRNPAETPKITLLGGTYSDDRLLRLYRSVDAYVMPSRGEGWGRPLMEAMASALPTIGTGWSGNTEFMTPDNAYLLEYKLVDVPPEAVAEAPHFAGHRWAEPSVAHLRALMREVFAHREAARAKGLRARAEVLERYDRAVVARQVTDHLQRLLGRPVASVPVRWEGSQFVYHSLAHVNRELSLALIASGEVDLSIVPYEPHQFDASTDQRLRPIALRLNRPLDRPAAVHVRHQWPPSFEPPAEGAWVMVQPWEFGGLPAEWVAPMRDLVDEIWVPSSWVRECYVRSGVPAEKVVVVPNGVDVQTYRPDGPKYRLRTTKRFKFLFVGGTIGRKGIDILLDTYTRAFSAADDVCLVVKAVGSTTAYRGSSIDAALRRIAATPDAPAIEFLADELSDADVASLYRACNVLVHPYRGEGFGLPIAEAMASGLAAIVTGYGAALDFCDEDTAFLVPAREVPVPQPNSLPEPSIGYWWAEPDRAALATIMRHVASDPDALRDRGRRARERIVERFQWEQAGRLVVERLKGLAGRTPLRLTAPPPFRPGIPPLPLDGRRSLAFLHHPRWSSQAWREVLTSYARSFGPEDDVTLVLWLDPAQGVAADEAGQRIVGALADAGIDAERCPDILLVPDELDLSGMGRLYAAVDCVVPHGDPLQAQRAELSGACVLRELSPAAWRAARPRRQLAGAPSPSRRDDGEEQAA